ARLITAGKDRVMHAWRGVACQGQDRTTKLGPELIPLARLHAVPDIARMLDRERLANIRCIMGKKIDDLAAMGVDDRKTLALLRAAPRPFSALDAGLCCPPLCLANPPAAGRLDHEPVAGRQGRRGGAAEPIAPPFLARDIFSPRRAGSPPRHAIGR